jgi:hypothetical protein
MILLRALTIATILLASPLGGRAQERILAAAGDIEIAEGFVTSAGPRAPTAAAYVTIVNKGSEDDRLTGASGAAARRVELHRHVLEDDVARMLPIPEGVPAPAGATVTLEPGGMHVMLMGLTEPLTPGASVALTLVFEKAGPLTLTLPVRGLGAPSGHGG